MALRLGEHVIRGEIFNDKPYSTHGWIELEGQEMPLMFELTGDCRPDFKGKRIYFRANPEHDWEIPKPLDPDLAKTLQWHQVGPTGVITADNWVRALPCPVEEFLSRSKLGEPPPTTWKRRFEMEWFGQNGRVLIELPGAIVETCIRPPDRNREGDDGEWALLPMSQPEPRPQEESCEEDAFGPEGGKKEGTDKEDDDSDPTTPSLDITILRREGDQFHVERRNFPTDSEADPAVCDPFAADIADDDPPSLPADLQRILDAAAKETDRQAGIRTPDDDFIDEMELMDDLMESSEGMRLLFFLDHPDCLPDPEMLNDRQVEIMLKSLLAELARFNIALHVCEHYTPRDTYRLLLDKILIECRAYRELRGTGWVQHLMTDEYCESCEAEAEREYSEMEEETPKEPNP